MSGETSMLNFETEKTENVTFETFIEFEHSYVLIKWVFYNISSQQHIARQMCKTSWEKKKIRSNNMVNNFLLCTFKARHAPVRPEGNDFRKYITIIRWYDNNDAKSHGFGVENLWLRIKRFPHNRLF